MTNPIRLEGVIFSRDDIALQGRLDLLIPTLVYGEPVLSDVKFSHKSCWVDTRAKLAYVTCPVRILSSVEFSEKYCYQLENISNKTMSLSDVSVTLRKTMMSEGINILNRVVLGLVFDLVNEEKTENDINP